MFSWRNKKNINIFELKKGLIYSQEKSFIDSAKEILDRKFGFISSSYIVNPSHAVSIKMPHPLLIVSQSDSFIQIIYINSHFEWQTVQIQISWLLQKPTDLDLHCLQRQGIQGFSRTRVKTSS